ncbi:MAG: 4Fe-4S dicluster domain-containing protein [Sulfolobales archaeon]
MVGKKLVVDLTKCVGCRYCELWCSFKHYGVFSSSLSRISLIKDDVLGLDYPTVCTFCNPAPCVASCPTGALSRLDNNVIYVDSGRCTSCSKCVNSCPYGALKLDPNTLKPIACDLCGGDPICVVKCPTGALRIYPTSVIKYGLEELSRLLGKSFEVALQAHKELMRLWGVRIE